MNDRFDYEDEVISVRFVVSYIDGDDYTDPNARILTTTDDVWIRIVDLGSYNLSLIDNNGNFLSEEKEDTPGGFISLNDDDDNLDRTADLKVNQSGFEDDN